MKRITNGWLATISVRVEIRKQKYDNRDEMKGNFERERKKAKKNASVI